MNDIFSRVSVTAEQSRDQNLLKDQVIEGRVGHGRNGSCYSGIGQSLIGGDVYSGGSIVDMACVDE